MRSFPSKQFSQDSFEAHVLNNAQDRIHSIKESAYTTGDIAEGEIKLATVSGTSYVYTRIGNTLYRAALTAV